MKNLKYKLIILFFPLLQLYCGAGPIGDVNIEVDEAVELPELTSFVKSFAKKHFAAKQFGSLSNLRVFKASREDVKCLGKVGYNLKMTKPVLEHRILLNHRFCLEQSSDILRIATVDVLLQDDTSAIKSRDKRALVLLAVLIMLDVAIIGGTVARLNDLDKKPKHEIIDEGLTFLVGANGMLLGPLMLIITSYYSSLRKKAKSSYQDIIKVFGLQAMRKYFYENLDFNLLNESKYFIGKSLLRSAESRPSEGKF